MDIVCKTGRFYTVNICSMLKSINLLTFKKSLITVLLTSYYLINVHVIYKLYSYKIYNSAGMTKKRSADFHRTLYFIQKIFNFNLLTVT